MSIVLQTSDLTSPPHRIVGKFKLKNGSASGNGNDISVRLALMENVKYIAVLIHCLRLYISFFKCHIKIPVIKQILFNLT